MARLSVPTGAVAASCVGASVELADDLDPFAHGPGDGQAVQKHVVLVVAAGGIAEDPEADVADDADRLDGLAEQRLDVEVGRIETEAALVAGVRQLRREPQAEGRTTGRFTGQPDLRGDDDVLDRAGLVAGDRELPGQRRGTDAAVRDRQAVVQPAVDLDLRDRADPDADAERGRAEQVALQPGRGEQHVAAVIESSLEQHQPRADDFGVFGHQRPLLRRRRRGREQCRRERQASKSPLCH